ncbi:hypothetical protein [Streptomyces prunicolor]|uniref:hypothetical protein n=1 Tax=Streptomyces prunicolor TaxID=67348 RepID=UPI000363489E|nr:hypothetical protein [Streptomyces prunicolor]
MNTADELSRQYVSLLGVSEHAASMAANLYLAIKATKDHVEAQQEFAQALQRIAHNEPWAAEMVCKIAELRPSASDHVSAATNSTTGEGDQRHTPFLANITCPNGRVTVTVDPAATVARATVRSTESTGRWADAARRATIRLVGNRVTVVVPEPEPLISHGTTFHSAYGSSYYFGDRVTVAGDFHVGDRVTNVGRMNAGEDGSSRLEVNVTLPLGSGVTMTTRNADLIIHGALAELDLTTLNGGLTAGVLGSVTVRGHNGSLTISAVQESADIETHNGRTTITTYSGSDARIISHNGSIGLTVARTARGRIEARSYQGAVTLHGVRGRYDLYVDARNRYGTVPTY